MQNPVRLVRRLIVSSRLAATAAAIAFALPAGAVVPKSSGGSLDAQAIFYPPFHQFPAGAPLSTLLDRIPNASQWRTFLEHHGEERVFLDPATGRIVSVAGAGIPWIPGSGNSLTLADLAASMTSPKQSAGLPELEVIARKFIADQESLFRIPAGVTFSLNSDASVEISPGFSSLRLDASAGGVPIRGGAVVFVVKHGNLILWGTEGLDDLASPAAPAVSADGAVRALEARIGGFLPGADQLLGSPVRWLFPERYETLHGYRDIWELRFSRQGAGTWVGRVDSATGELVELQDDNDYAQVRGGVYPTSNYSGSEVTRPFGFADYGAGLYSDGGGAFTYPGGTVTSSLKGKYVNIVDKCGTISLSANSAPGDLDFGASSGTNCLTPGFGGSGNTHAARSCYYHVDLIKQKGRAYLPTNKWLKGSIKANVNLTGTCNAFWDGTTINFFQTTGGCGNTGEIAAIFLHEWGHGLDQNDGNGSGGSGEAMGDTVAMLQLRNSCIGPNFFTSNCGGYGNACLSCTGVRDQDRFKHATNEILTPKNIDARCPGGGDPCGQEVHCEGELPANTVWDLAYRDLPDRADLDVEDSWALADKLWWESGPTRNAAYTCSNKTGPPWNNGCGFSSWFETFLAADDANGNLADGTPHASTIFLAFDRHGISCGVATDPSNKDSIECPSIGGVGTITAAPGNASVTLAWSKASGAAAYRILRNNLGCGFGMTEVARPADDGGAAQSFFDATASNGTAWYYQIQPIGANSDCTGPISNCTGATPVPAPEARYLAATALQTADSGDNDGFPDNCETITVRFTVENRGSTALTSVSIPSVSSPFAGVKVTTAMPILLGSLALGATVNGTFQYSLGGGSGNASCDQILPFTIQVAAAEMTGTRSGAFSFVAEKDMVPTSSLVYSFESNLEGWSIVSGTFTRTSAYGGSNGTYALASSSSLDGQCDNIRSPLFRPAATSTLTIATRYDIEPKINNVWNDRANVAIYEPAADTRTTINPVAGRLYNVSGPNGTCVTADENGWAATSNSWADSSGFDLTPFAGKLIQVDVGYGTNGSASGNGFRFDNVRLTNVSVVACDAHADNCGACDNPASVDVTPNSGSVCTGTSVLLGAAPSGGTGPFTYQWTEDGLDLSGATSATLSIAKSTAQRHSYNCRVSGSGCPSGIPDGSASAIDWSSPATVTFTDSPDPSATGQSASFAATVTGGASPFVYDWSWGDGSPHGTGSNPAHVYSATASPFTVTLTVTDIIGCVTTVSNPHTVTAGLGTCTTTTLFSDDFEAGTAKWNLTSGGNPWIVSTTNFGSPSTSIDGRDPNTILGKNKCALAAMAASVAIPAGNALVQLSFWSQAGLAADDNGIVEISTDSGSTWSKLTTVAYPSTVTTVGTAACPAPPISSGNPAFAGTVAPASYTADLAAFKGKSIRIRFTSVTGGTNSANSHWWVDDVKIVAQDGTAPAPVPGSGTSARGDDAVDLYGKSFGGGNLVYTLAWGHVTNASKYRVYRSTLANALSAGGRWDAAATAVPPGWAQIGIDVVDSPAPSTTDSIPAADSTPFVYHVNPIGQGACYLENMQQP